MFSIIIPAHNEVSVLSATLVHMFLDKKLTNCEVIVVCNGCSDNTVEVAEGYVNACQSYLKGNSVDFSIIDTEIASKTNAINLGVSRAKYKQVVLLDADILVNGSDIMGLVGLLSERDVCAAAPKLNFVYKKSSWLVRRYFDLVKHSSYNQKHRLSNVIALSEKGIKKIGVLPEIIADDEYIRRQFFKTEYQIIDTLAFDFICPKTFFSLLQVLTRVERGNIQLAHLHYLDKSGANSQGFDLIPWPSLPVFIFAKVFSVARAKIQFKFGKVRQWERDESNR